MSGWVRFESAWWPELAERLPKPWPKAAAMFDLRYHADLGKPLGRVACEHRWGWTNWAVRALLSSTEWHDPLRAPTVGRPPTNRAPTADQPPVNGSHVTIARIPTADQPPTDRAPTVDQPPLLDPRSPTRSRSQGQTSPSVEATDRAPDRFDEAARFWAFDVQTALGRKPGRPTGKASQVGQKLLRALKKDADTVLDAMRFVAHSSSDRAVFLRGERPDGEGRTFDLTLMTVLRHVDEYAELWRGEQAGGARLRPRARGEHPSERQPRKTVAELAAEDPHLWDPL